MPSHITLRMQFGPHQDPDEITGQLLELVRAAPVEEIMFFVSGESMNDGYEPLERLEVWIEHSRPYRRALADAGILVSLNPWYTLMHRGGNGRKPRPGQEWQWMVDQHGRVGELIACPLDEGWHAYFEAALQRYAREEFRVIWVEDDIRLHNHAPLDWGGCFCPLHLEAFRRRTGIATSREEVVANCTAPGEPHPWRGLWMDMWNATFCALLSRWRQIVEAGGSRLGLMSSAPENHAAEGRRWEDWWKALAGEKPPIHRPSFWDYRDVPAGSLPRSIALLEQNRTVQPADVECGPEIDCYSYGRWNKSFRQTGAQMALAHILGATNLNVSLYDFLGNRPDDEPERADFLRDWRPTLDWLTDIFPMSMRAVGVGLPWSPEMSRRIHTVGDGTWQSLTCPSRGWANWLGASGHAFTVRPSPTVNAPAGPVVWSFAEEELRAWLSGGLLLDGEAASILVERGLGELIGVRNARFISQQEVLYTAEECLDADFALRAGAQMTMDGWPHAARLFQGELDAKARVVSDLRGPTQEVVGHGLVVYDNELGGRVAIVPWSADRDTLVNVQRAVQLTKTLAYLDPSGAHGSVSGGAWLVPQFLTDGAVWRGVIWNAGGDAVEEVVLNLPAGMAAPDSATHVNGRGGRSTIPVQENRVLLESPLHAWEFLVLANEC